ncbi:CYFA0S06e01420g1_1 [Cyberlindnera fabianii]|uniref:CYFA0S06e01420g1_1 n=1 Tax=Cyberlindnera fabianii TaxID=36022 RepID=A0A061B254_CYBFA|nr:CYFA0S06e01420g1_1 [Cyberlindnera fabianii]
MPLNIIGSMIMEGPDVLPGWEYIAKYAPPLAVIASLKYYFRGRTNTWERDLHGKVYIVTGGTSGLGAAVVDDLAARGAQIILLVRSTDDFWTAEYITDLREKHDNFLIYAEECDLASLYSIRKFATKWLDNMPPRRVDAVVCCAAESLPYGKERINSDDGIEIQTAVNYAGHFHLLTLLAPSLKAQLADRDVRVILTTCMSQSMAVFDVDDPLFQNKRYPTHSPWKVFGTSKLQLGMFAKEFQRRLLEQPRKDGQPSLVRVNLVNPGLMRSPSTKRVLTFGSLVGLLIYLLVWPILWIFLKLPVRGAQSVFYALMSPDFETRDGGNFISDCELYHPARHELEDEDLQKQLYDNTEAAIAKIEKESAIRRKKDEAKTAKKQEKQGKDNKDDKQNVGITTTKNEDDVPLFPGMKGLGDKLAAKNKNEATATSTSSQPNKTNSKSKAKGNKKKKKT